ncbi:hypothetical protein FHR83_004339 [Actinoplanes campanulatus]|uniref:ABC transporter domain-containing protein n=1 Tax=Actinoplanes campanulatus TaxID=113559 RepID=A0A7W5AIF6_9ACTN|nr:ATP-binding cassette domain-containing protein [Actinoplanes campanulatus]MBB3096665.1 hypothetical protein [Actinoplanes campanulatus]GGN30543.1 hypothetical protein GCM10010109_50230 [Actinoplanes campanulatus]GID37208.1 hypothetical protein Aca09nite_37140 [Actinoplanes campanulatus]
MNTAPSAGRRSRPRAGLSRTTRSEITGELLGRGAIVVTATDARRRAGSGRPAELPALDPRSGQFLGVDLGHTRARVVVADAAHEIIASGVTQYALFPWLTVRRNVEFGLRTAGVPRQRRREIADRFIELVGLGEFAEALPKTLSGGMKQRVAIARAYAVNP